MNFKRKILKKNKPYLLISFFLVFSCISIALGISNMGNKVNATSYPIIPNYTISNFLIGNGESEETAYEIFNLAELEKLSINVNHGGINYADKFFKLTADIDLNGMEWEPIGGYNNSVAANFAGYFDGDGKRIYNFKIENIVDKFRIVENEGTIDEFEYITTEYRARDYGGLFGYTNGGSIKNLIIDNVSFGTFAKNIDGETVRDYLGNYHGAVAGYSNGTSFENINVSNVSISNFKSTAGGVVGYSNTNSRYTDIFVDGIIINQAQTTNAYVGGMIGQINTANNLTNINVKNININVTGNYVAGITGQITSTTNIYSGKINNINISGASYVGGIYGRSETTTTINGDINTDTPFEIDNLTIKASAAYAGGIGGYAVGTVNRASNVKIKNANITNTVGSASYVGGLYGRFSGNNSTIERCEFGGEIYSTHDYVGGAVGYTEGDVYIFDTIINSQSINGRHFVGGIVGSGAGSSTAASLDAGTAGLVIANCRMEGYVVARMGSAGGLLGYGRGFAVKECLAQGSVQALSGGNTAAFYAAGGIVGYADHATAYTIINNHVKMSVLTSSVSSNNNHAYSGGIIGYDSGVATKQIRQNMIMGEILAFSSGGSASASNVFAGGLMGVCNYATVNNTLDRNVIMPDRIQAQRGTTSSKTGVRSHVLGHGTTAANVPRAINANYFAHWLQSNNANNAEKNGWKLENWLMGTTFVPTAAPVPLELTSELMYEQSTYTGATLSWSPSTWAINPNINDGLPYLRLVGAPSTTFLGSKENPYLVRGMQDLLDMKSRTAQGDTLAGRNYRVAYNLDLNGDQVIPIGETSFDKAFAGKFDGNNRTISNFTFAQDNTDSIGFFARTLFAEIKNVTFDNLSFTNTESKNYVATVSGWSGFTMFNNVHVKNTNLDIVGNYVGGISGDSNSVWIDNCSVKSSTFKATGSYAGGLMARATYGRGFARDCVVEANVISGSSYSGGLVGQVLSQATGTDNANNGTYRNYAMTIQRSSFAGHVFAKSSYAGGLIGQAQAARIYESYSNGTVSARGAYAGGLIGHANTTPYIIQNCAVYTNVYSVSGNSNTVAGGIIGQASIAATGTNTDCTVMNSIVQGDVIAISSHVTGNYTSYAGGIIGHSTSTNNSVGGCVIMSPRIAAYGGVGATYRAHQIGTGSAAANNPVPRTASPVLNYCLNTTASAVEGNKGTTYAPSFNATTQLANKTITDLSNQSLYIDLGWLFGTSNPWTRMSSQNQAIPFLTARSFPSTSLYGSANNPIKITTREEFFQLSKDINEGDPKLGLHFKLEVDIDLTFFPWTPSSFVTQNFFGGNLNGNNKLISNISMEDINTNDYQSLFGKTIAGSISNLTIENFELAETGNYAGVLSGASSYTLFKNININNSKILNTGANNCIGGVVGYSFRDTFDNVKLTNLTLQGAQRVGGLAGSAEADIALNSSVDGFITARSSMSGGIFGCLENLNSTSTTRHGTLIEGCSTSGNIVGTSNVGGIVGQTSSANHGHVINTTINQMDVKASGSFVGGIIGVAPGSAVNHATIEKSGNTGNVSSTVGGGRVGGLVGNGRGVNIKESYNTGTVRNIHSASATTYVGGLIGLVSAYICNIENSFNSGEVVAFSSSSASTSSHFIAGGIVGSWVDGGQAAKIAGGTISNTYNSGNIYSVSYINSTNHLLCLAGGIVGYGLATSSIMINNCFNIADIVSAYTPAGSSAGGVASNAIALTLGTTAVATTNLPSVANGATTYIGSNVRVNPYFRTNSTTGNLGALWPTNFTPTVQVRSQSSFQNLANIGSLLGWSNTIWGQDSKINGGFPYPKNAPQPTYNPGSKQNPFKIGTAEELRAFRDEVNAGDSKQGQYYQLSNNINLTENNWIPIGSSSAPFMGNFNGKEFVISNLKTNTNQDNWGLFGYVTNATITNLLINDIDVNMTVSGGDNVGGIVGFSSWGLTMDKCAVLRGKITVTGGAKGIGIGGLVGNINNNLPSWIFNKITRSYSTCDISGRGLVGGVAGRVYGAEISQCMASGTIAATNNHDAAIYAAGGIIGRCEGTSSQITDCTFTGTVTSSVLTASQSIAGGIVGNNAIANVSTLPGDITIPRTRIIRCFTVGNVSAINALVGTGVTQGAFSGGILGYGSASSEINFCAVASKRITATATTAPVEFSTLFGNASSVANKPVGEQNFYSNDVLLSQIKQSTTLFSNFINTTFAIENTPEQMNAIETYNSPPFDGLGWDFSIIWDISPMRNNGFPTLKPLPIDPTRLLGAIQRAEELYKRSDWSNVTFTKFESALNAAKALLTMEVSDYFINAAIDAIEIAIADLRAEKSELIELEAYIRVNVEPFATSYITFVVMQQALTQARLILADNTNTFKNAHVNDAVSALNTARSGLQVNKATLNSLIDRAMRLPSTGYLMDGEWGYIKLMEDRLPRAMSIKNNQNATATAVGNMVLELQTALDALVIDYSGLTEILIQSRLFSGLDFPGFNSEVFTESSWSAFINKYNIASEIDTQRTANINEVSTARLELSTALKALTPNDALLRQLFNNVKAETSTYYSPDTWSVFSMRLNEASVILSMTAPIPAELQNRISAISNAYNNLSIAYDNLVLDVSPLSAYIILAKEEHESMPIGPGKVALGAAIEEAERIVAFVTAADGRVPNKTQTKSEISAAFAGLDENINTIEAAKLALLYKINEVELLYPESNASAYTSETWDAFITTLDMARFYHATNDNISTIKNQTKTLDDAAKALKLDKSGLNNLIAEMEELNSEHFNTESFDRLLAALGNAKDVLENEIATNDAIMNAIIALNTAKLLLEPEKGDLITLVDSYKNLTNEKYKLKPDNSAIITDITGAWKIHAVYTTGSWNIFTLRLNDAQAVLSNSSANHNQVQLALLNLHIAIDELEIDFSDINTRIEMAGDCLESLYYTDASKQPLLVNLGTVLDIVQEENIGLEDIQLCLDSLLERMQNLVITTEPLIDSVTVMDELIEVHYSYESWARFRIALNGAKNFLEQTVTFTHDSIKSMHQNLLSAYNQLEVDKTSLRSAIAMAEAVKHEFVEATSYANLLKLINDANNVSVKIGATEAEIEQVYNALMHAIPRLTPNKIKLQGKIDEALNLYNKVFAYDQSYVYTTATRNALNLVLTTANTEMAKANVTLETEIISASVATVNSIIDIFNNLNIAIENLKVDVNGLNSALNTANIIITKVYGERPSSDFYTTQTWILFMTAYNTALMHTGETKNVNIVEEKTMTLLDAINNLTINKTELTTAILSINSLRQANYTETSWQNLMTAKDDAIILRDLDEHDPVEANRFTIEKMITAIANINEKINALVIDTELLDGLLAEISELEESDYTALSWSTLQTQVAIATGDLEGEDISLIVNNLVNAYSALVNIKVLREEVIDMLEFINQQGDIFYKYTLTSWNSFVSIVETTAGIVDNPLLTNANVNSAISSMQVAKNALVDISELRNLINELESLYSEKDHLYGESEFDFLLQEITFAKNVLNNGLATKTQVNNAMTRILNAEDTLLASALDYEYLLEELYLQVVDYDPNDYTVSSFYDFNSVLMDVAELFGEEPVTLSQQEYYEIFVSLQNAVNELVNISELKELIDDINAVFTYDEENNIFFETDSDPIIQYTNLSSGVLKSTLTQAHVVLGKDNATKQEVNDALNELADAVLDLIEFSNRGLLLEAYNNALKLLDDEDKYSRLSFENFNQKMQNANSIINDSNASEIDITNAIDELENAISSLIDVADLKSLLADANAIYNELYTMETKSALTQAIAEANIALAENTIAITNADVTTHIGALTECIGNLVLDEYRINSLLESVSSYNEAQFSQGYLEFLMAKTDLQSTMETGTVLQKIAAYENLITQKNKLKVNTTSATALISQFNALNSAWYSTGYTNARQNITALETGISNSSISIESFTTLMQNAQNAMNAMTLHSKQALADAVAYYETNQSKYTTESYIVFKFIYLDPAKSILTKNTPMTQSEITNEVQKIQNGAKDPSAGGVLVELETNNMIIVDDNKTTKLHLTDSNGNKIVRDESYIYNPEEQNYLTNIAEGVSLTKIKEQLVPDSGTLKFFDINGKEITNLNATNAATGIEMRLYYGDVVADVIVLVVKGDITGDGIISGADITKLYDSIYRDAELTDAQKLAGQINDDNKITMKDVSEIFYYMQGTGDSDLFNQTFGYSA